LFLVHLAVVQQHGVRCQPVAAQHDLAVHLRLQIHTRHQAQTRQYRQGGARVHAGLQRYFLGGARQLPAPQRQREGHSQQRRQGDQPEPETRIHRIIQSMKYWVILAFIGILGSLATALFFMMKNKSDDSSRSKKMVWALALRVGVSIVLFASILMAWKFGYIQPTGIVAGQ